MATAEPGGGETTTTTNGIDSSKNLVEVMTKAATEAALARKQDNITVSSSAPTSSDGADGDIWLTYGADSGTLPENVLTQAQLDAVDSGITATKVTTYDGYATTIAGKQDKLTAGSNITISGNTISATDTKYTLPTASASVLGGVKVGSGLSISNGVLSATGGGGGASLPADGYYWQKITEENWPTDWVKDDVMLIYLNLYVTGTGTNWTTVPSSIKTAVSSVTVPYMITFESATCSISGYSTNFIPIMIVETTGVTKWNTSGDIISIKGIAFNGAGVIISTRTTISRSTISRYGLYRLRKFSS